MNRHTVIALLLASTLLSGCVPAGMLVGAAAGTGIAAGQEGGLKAAVSDTAIRARINDYWFKYDTEMFSKVKLTVDQGRVLLTGVVQKPEHRIEAVRLAWQAKGVKQVINEIQVGNSQSFGSYAQDKWITSQLRTQMIFDKNIQSINYSVDTVKGIVYLMGVAQTSQELQRAVRLAQKTKGVKQVVSYVKMVGEPIVADAKGSTEGPGQISSPVNTNINTNMSPAAAASPNSSAVYQPAAPMPAYSAPAVPQKTDIQSEALPP